MKNALEYIPAIVAFVAVVMGISAFDKWDSTQAGFRKVTPFGWATGGLGVAALVASSWLTRSKQKEAGRQVQQREHLRKISHAEARLALREITSPFFILFGDDTEGTMLDLVPQHIEDPDKLGSVMRIDVRSNSPFDDGSGPVPWNRVLKGNADRGASRIDRVMQIYAAYLEPEVLEALSELRTSEFLVLRLQSLDMHLAANQRLKFLEFPFVNAPDMSDCWGFGGFWKMMREVDRVLIKDPERLRWRL
jgi:hypothetical protein